MLSQIILVVVFTAAFQVQRHDDNQRFRAFEQANTVVCEATRQANTSFNKALDNIIQAAITSRVLTEAQKAERIAAYAPLHLPVLDCPVPR